MSPRAPAALFPVTHATVVLQVGAADVSRAAGAVIVAMLILALAACAPSGASQPTGSTAVAGGRLKVVATTTIVGDVVRNVGGDAIDLTVMLPPGADPHGFEPTPADIANVSKADAVFINGLQLESFLTTMMLNAGDSARIVAVSDGIMPIEASETHEEDAAHEEKDTPGSGDPHTWTDPTNVMVWVDNIRQNLNELDPTHASTYEANAAAYKAQLQALDGWISDQVAMVPAANRKLVTDHAIFGYFANRYGFEQVGSVIPGYSTLSEPSAQEIASLEDALRALGVNAIFVGNTVNSALSQRVADDAGIRIVPVFTGSLSGADGPASTYLDYMHFDVGAFVDALKS